MLLLSSSLFLAPASSLTSCRVAPEGKAPALPMTAASSLQKRETQEQGLSSLLLSVLRGLPPMLSLPLPTNWESAWPEDLAQERCQLPPVE